MAETKTYIRDSKGRFVRYISDEERESIAKMYMDGLGIGLIAKITNHSPYTIHYILKEKGVKIRSFREGCRLMGLRKRIKPNLERSYHLSYILGVLFGDGWSNTRNRSVFLKNKDPDFVREFCESLRKIGVPSKVLSYKEKGMYYFGKGYSAEFAEWCRMIKYRRPLDIDGIMEIVKGYENAFLRGFFRSEGTLLKRPYGTYVYLCQKDPEIVKLVRKILEQANFKTSYYPSCRRIYILGGKKESKRFLEFIGMGDLYGRN